MRVLLAVVAAALLAGCATEAAKQDHIQVALVNAGVRPDLADCMSHRMAQKLTVAQLHHLAQLGGPKQGWADYVYAVQRVNDPDALEVLLSSYAMCKAGLIH